MKKHLLLPLVLIILIASSCSHQRVRDLNKHTPKEDAYWNDMALISTEEKTPIFVVLEENYPSLYNEILSDAKDPILPMFWGKSTNFDSGAKKKIVDDQIIADLQAKFNIKNNNEIVHAGIMHTYGYLFSTIQTPYGQKRKRWIEPTLNYGFALKGNSLSPDAIEGGLLSNLTYFAGMLTLADKTKLSTLKNVSNEVFTYDYDKLSVDRVEEQTKDFVIVTTLVHLPFRMDKEDNEYLLIYSINDLRVGQESLITVFPITADSYKKLVSSDIMGPNQKITLRYNAYLDGVEKNLTGTRRLIKK